MPLVSDALCPMFISFLPGLTPGVSASTMKPVNAFPAEHLGSGFVLDGFESLNIEFRKLR